MAIFKFKSIIVFLIKSILKKVNYVFSYALFSKVKNTRDLFFTYWISSEFNSFGNKTKISFPLDLKGGKHINVGNSVTIGKNSILNAWKTYLNYSFTPEIIIGNNTHLGEGIHISATTKISVGNNVLIGRRVSIIDNSHGDSSLTDLMIAPANRKLYSKGPIIIENNVWIGDKVTILSGVVIGTNSVIGANSVVTKNIPKNSIVGGIPAKIIKTIN